MATSKERDKARTERTCRDEDTPGRVADRSGSLHGSNSW